MGGGGSIHEGSPYTEPAVASVPDVVARLKSIRAYAESHEPRGAHDGVASFTYLYTLITQRVLAGLRKGAFADNEFMERLDIVFANRYLDAIRCSIRQPDTTPSVWAALIRERQAKHVSRMQFAAAGVNAHVNFDLAVAVADTCTAMGSPPRDGSKHVAYQQINHIFADEMQRLREYFESPWERALDRVFARALNKVDDLTVVVTRDLAWGDAEELWSLRQAGGDESPFIAWLDKRAAGFGHLLLAPVV